MDGLRDLIRKRARTELHPGSEPVTRKLEIGTEESDCDLRSRGIGKELVQPSDVSPRSEPRARSPRSNVAADIDRPRDKDPTDYASGQGISSSDELRPLKDTSMTLCGKHSDRASHSHDSVHVEGLERRTIMETLAVAEFQRPSRLKVENWMLQMLTRWRRMIRDTVERDAGASERIDEKNFLECEKATSKCIAHFATDSRSAINDMFDRLSHVCDLADEGKFREAVQEYLATSIGSSAWVTGVGNCFIQERSGNDKIREVSHPMNDMFVRDFMQTFKRLLSKVEKMQTSSERG